MRPMMVPPKTEVPGMCLQVQTIGHSAEVTGDPGPPRCVHHDGAMMRLPTMNPGSAFVVPEIYLDEFFDLTPPTAVYARPKSPYPSSELAWACLPPSPGSEFPPVSG